VFKIIKEKDFDYGFALATCPFCGMDNMYRAETKEYKDSCKHLVIVKERNFIFTDEEK